MTKLLVVFPSFANALKKSSVSCNKHTHDLSITDLLKIIVYMMMMIIIIIIIQSKS